MAELVEFRMSADGKLETRPAVAKGQANPHVWKCGPCDSGVGTCCVSRSAPAPKPKQAKKAAAVDEREAFLRQQIESIKKGSVKL